MIHTIKIDDATIYGKNLMKSKRTREKNKTRTRR
jgi:hypothetical protein